MNLLGGILQINSFEKIRMTIEVKKFSENFFKNGDYQKIFWLGVNGYIIVNERDKEILLIDPWPSYLEVPAVSSLKINLLANWLVKQVKEENYKLVGIIGTHEHFDHIADIPSLYYILKENLSTLPPLYADEGTLDQIRSRWTLVSPITQLKDFVLCNSLTLNGDLLYYDDEIQEDKEKKDIENYPLKAGTKLDEINIGKFLVTPYIWDHSSTANASDALSGVKSGNYQRCTAIFLKCQNDPELKTLFHVGSAGEMNGKYTGHHVNDITIKTDVLIQSITHIILWVDTYLKKLKSLIRYQCDNIIVKDKVFVTHYENFVDKGLRKKSNYINGIEEFRGLLRIINYVYWLGIYQVRKEVLEKYRVKEVYYMNRFLFEYDNIILDDYSDIDSSEVPIEEKDDDFWLRFSTVSYF